MRRLLAALAVGLLFASAGCTGLFGGGGVSDEQLDEEPPEPYDWNATTDARVVVHDASYSTVYDLNGTTELRLFSRGLTSESPLSVRALRYRYPNGTVVNGSSDAVEVSTDGSRRVVTVPNGSGAVAFTASSGGKQLGLPAFVEGSYEVVLPPNTRTSAFLFGEVSPGGYETRVDEESRLHITWEEVTDGVLVRYYLQRDVLLFRGLLVAVGVVGGGGLLVLYRQIRRLRKQREELGLDVDVEDEDDLGGGGPPPGMR
ncbi:hypothetical protein BRD18_02550 [Halobacteriales archaeon SW_7_71_33]|nr:MAG: hypothetical protein BRD18_02550 [Halobacteriales archaeon SW_7_71_33]